VNHKPIYFGKFYRLSEIRLKNPALQDSSPAADRFRDILIFAAVPLLRWAAKRRWHLLNNDRNEVKKDPAITVFYLIENLKEFPIG